MCFSCVCQGLPFTKIAHSITAQDHQPTPDCCILSMVVGQLKVSSTILYTLFQSMLSMSFVSQFNNHTLNARECMFHFCTCVPIISVTILSNRQTIKVPLREYSTFSTYWVVLPNPFTQFEYVTRAIEILRDL